MRIPKDAKIIRDGRLTLIRAVCTLYDQLVDADDGLKDQVKAVMTAKEVKYAQSDLVVARLQGGGDKSYVCPRMLFELMNQGTITIDQFVACIRVSAKPLEQFLSGEQIEAISKSAAGSKSLVTEFKPDVKLDENQLAALLTDAIEKFVHAEDAGCECCGQAVCPIKAKAAEEIEKFNRTRV